MKSSKKQKTEFQKIETLAERSLKNEPQKGILKNVQKMELGERNF